MAQVVLQAMSSSPGPAMPLCMQTPHARHGRSLLETGARLRRLRIPCMSKSCTVAGSLLIDFSQNHPAALP